MRALLLAALALAQTVAPQPHGMFWDSLPDGQVLRPCAADSTAWRNAQQRLTALSGRIERLKPADSAEAAVRDLHTLLKHDCFLMTWEAERVPTPDSVEALQHWWTESAGNDWLASFLELPEYGDVSQPRPHVIALPAVRHTFDLESAPTHPLRDLLCSRDDVPCGAATRGWTAAGIAILRGQSG